MTVRELAAAAADRLKRARIPEPRREAEALLAHAFGKDEVWVVGHGDEAVPPAKAKAYAATIARRAAHEPFAYLVGERWFYGRRFRVTKDVLIPRPETEVLVEAVLARAPDAAMTILDVGTGSGAIGLSLAAARAKAKVVLYDISRKALNVARTNARALRLATRVRLVTLDVLRRPPPEPQRAKMSGRTYLPASTALVANLPYLAETAWRAAQPEVRKHEPRLALVSGKDGLRHYRALIEGLARWKRPPDLLALEAEPRQLPELRRLVLGLMPGAQVEILKDLHGDDRVLVASKRKRP